MGDATTSTNAIYRRPIMLRAALAFFILAIIAGILGFGGIAAGATQIAQILFLLFLVLFVFSLVGHAFRGSNPRV